MSFGIFIHRADSIYDDSPATQYQFPKQYLGRAERCVGDWIIYYEPTKVALSRGIMRPFHHVRQQHLHRYMSEFDFRYNNRIALGVDDQHRATRALAGAKGKRLTDRKPDAAVTA